MRLDVVNNCGDCKFACLSAAAAHGMLTQIPGARLLPLVSVAALRTGLFACTPRIRHKRRQPITDGLNARLESFEFNDVSRGTTDYKKEKAVPIIIGTALLLCGTGYPAP